MTEPILILRTAIDASDTIARRAWFNRVRERAHAAGVTFFRMSTGYQAGDLTIPWMVIEDPSAQLLFEGWTKQPEDQGAARWGNAEAFP